MCRIAFVLIFTLALVGCSGSNHVKETASTEIDSAKMLEALKARAKKWNEEEARKMVTPPMTKEWKHWLSSFESFQKSGSQYDSEVLEKWRETYFEFRDFLTASCPKIVEGDYYWKRDEHDLCRQYSPNPEHRVFLQNETPFKRGGPPKQSKLVASVCEKAKSDATFYEKDKLKMCLWGMSAFDRLDYLMTAYLDELAALKE